MIYFSMSASPPSESSSETSSWRSVRVQEGRGRHPHGTISFCHPRFTSFWFDLSSLKL